MTLRHYHIFVTVCDEMNMTAAARKLFMSQSAVSQAISELETYYGVRLFERLSRKLYLTQAGEKLQGYARHIIRMNLDAENEMRSLNRSGSLRVGASVTIGAWVLPKLISAFQKEEPELTVEVVEDNTAKIERLIRSDKLDLALVEGEITLPDIICKPFAEDMLVLVCGSGHPFVQKLKINPEELEGESFILREVGSGTRKTFENVMNENAVKWNATWICNNSDTIKLAVAENLGVSVISLLAVKKEIEEGQLYRIDIEGISFARTFKLAYHKNKYLTEALNKFIRFAMNGAAAYFD